MLFSERILLRYLCRTKRSWIKRRHDRNNLISDAIEILGKRKRVKSKNNKVGKKRRVTGNNGGVDRNGEIDRISELPESIIHYIFSFLHCTKDLVRTTVLSRNMKNMFNSYNSFDFDEKWFRESRGNHNQIEAREMQKKGFRSYVEKSIATRLEPLVSIEKFRLHVENVDRSLVASWVRSAIDKKVKELDIRVHNGDHFSLPYVVAVSPSIISLKLSGRILHPFYANLCNLRELSIKDTRFFTAYEMNKFEESCPLIEDLRLVCCRGLSYLSISSLVKLKRLEVQDCEFIDRIQIASPKHLESFWYHAKNNQRCKFDLRDTEILKILTLKDRMMSESFFEDWIHRCPMLEKLVVHECTRLEKIKISSEKLRSLALIKCVKLSEATIDAPNLYSLEYSGHLMPFRSMNASRLCQLKLSFLPIEDKNQSLWTFRHRDIFGDCDGLKGLKFILYSNRTMKIFEDVTEVTHDQHNFEKIELAASSTNVLKTVDNWLQQCQGKSLILISSNNELMELISRMIMEREDYPSCCRYYSYKCWRHYLADVKVSTLEIVNETCYDFTWRSRKT